MKKDILRDCRFEPIMNGKIAAQDETPMVRLFGSGRSSLQCLEFPSTMQYTRAFAREESFAHKETACGSICVSFNPWPSPLPQHIQPSSMLRNHLNIPVGSNCLYCCHERERQLQAPVRETDEATTKSLQHCTPELCFPAFARRSMFGE